MFGRVVELQLEVNVIKSGLSLASSLKNLTSTQKETLALNWISRPGVMAMVMVPNCGVFTYRFGVPRFTLFNALKASPRNCRLVLSPK